MNIPLIGFALVLGLYWIGAFIILYHLVRFGVGTGPKLSAIIFFFGSVILLIIATAMYIHFDYNALIASF